jgi:ketopantoate reductase
MNITICGCGNGAHACAALLCRKGHTVNVFSPLSQEVERFKASYGQNDGMTLHIGDGLLGKIGGVFSDRDQDRKLKLNKITDNPAEVIPDSSLIIVIVPAFAHRNILVNIKDYVAESSRVVVLPSRGGLEFEANTLMPKTKFIAFQTLPWACRIKKFGSEINVSGLKNKIQAASIPAGLPQEYFDELEELFDLKIERLKSALTLTLANIGQIFHPGIMYGLFRKNPAATFLATDIPLFYENVDKEIADILSTMSDEIRAVARELGKVNPNVESEKVLHVSDWLRVSYEGLMGDTSSLPNMFRTNAAYKGIKAPVVKVADNLYAPDFTARYIVEDIPFGLLVTRSIAEMVQVATPTIDKVLSNIGKWTNYDYYEKLNAVKSLAPKSRLPEFHGINSSQQLRGL